MTTVADAIATLASAKNLTLRQADAVVVLTKLVQKLQALERYEAHIAGGCECCGTWIEHEFSNYGEWVKHEDLYDLLNQDL